MLPLCCFAVAHSNSSSRTCGVAVPPGTVGHCSTGSRLYGCFWAKCLLLVLPELRGCDPPHLSPTSIHLGRATAKRHEQSQKCWQLSQPGSKRVWNKCRHSEGRQRAQHRRGVTKSTAATG